MGKAQTRGPVVSAVLAYMFRFRVKLSLSALQVSLSALQILEPVRIRGIIERVGI